MPDWTPTWRGDAAEFLLDIEADVARGTKYTTLDGRPLSDVGAILDALIQDRAVRFEGVLTIDSGEAES